MAIEVPIYGFNEIGQSLEEAVAPEGGIYGDPSLSGVVSRVITQNGETILPLEGSGALLLHVSKGSGREDVGFYNYETLVEAGDTITFWYRMFDVEPSDLSEFSRYSIRLVADIYISDIKTGSTIYSTDELNPFIGRSSRDGDSVGWEHSSHLVSVGGRLSFDLLAFETGSAGEPELYDPKILLDKFSITKPSVGAVPLSPSIAFMAPAVFGLGMLACRRTRTPCP
jgi:hypothetical protein